jgi:hypothetical protein
MRAIFIRHGESTGNAGVPCHDLATIELTERGHEQARAVAASWTQAPALIVTSPYTRTRQTAAPTIARFSGVPVECGRSKSSPICNRRAGTARAAPSGCRTSNAIGARPILIIATGKGGELRHASTALRDGLARLAAMPAGLLVYVFGHGHHPKAARSSPMPIWTIGARCWLLAQGRTARDQQHATGRLHWFNVTCRLLRADISTARHGQQRIIPAEGPVGPKLRFWLSENVLGTWHSVLTMEIIEEDSSLHHREWVDGSEYSGGI